MDPDTTQVPAGDDGATVPPTTSDDNGQTVPQTPPTPDTGMPAEGGPDAGAPAPTTTGEEGAPDQGGTGNVA
jgi:hypothetical protein